MHNSRSERPNNSSKTKQGGKLKAGGGGGAETHHPKQLHLVEMEEACRTLAGHAKHRGEGPAILKRPRPSFCCQASNPAFPHHGEEEKASHPEMDSKPHNPSPARPCPQFAVHSRTFKSCRCLAEFWVIHLGAEAPGKRDPRQASRRVLMKGPRDCWALSLGEGWLQFNKG